MIINPHVGTMHIPEFNIPPIGTNGRDNKAELFSLGITGSVCMKFYFYFNGNETGHLKILVRNYRSYKDRVVFHRYGNHGHKWNFAQIYLDSVPNTAYQIIIWGDNAGPNITGSIAIDDISFENGTCDQLPQGLNQYTARSKIHNYYSRPTLSALRSPIIYEHNACFTFQYYETSIGYYSDSRVSVFIRIANNSQLLPSWTKDIHEERGEWRTIKILLAHQSGFNQ
ncbi:MAM and LDL-receptor class A domain-containing 1-like isoform X4, partial [Paramuricea clavata]